MPRQQSVISLDPIDRKKKIGLIGRMLITTHHGGKSVLKTDPFGHYLFCGEQRQGKTASVLWFAERLVKKYEKKGFVVKLYSNFGVGQPFVKENLFTLIDQFDPYAKEIRIVLIDEVHTYFPRGNVDKKTQQTINDLNAVFSQLGKRNTYVLSTAQIYGRLDKALREQCLYMVDCHINRNKRIVNEFIPQKDILADDLGRWAGRPKKIFVHGLSKMEYDTKKLIRE